MFELEGQTERIMSRRPEGDKTTVHDELEELLDHLERVEITLARVRNALAAVKRQAARVAEKLPPKAR
jgi:hypothetical protein